MSAALVGCLTTLAVIGVLAPLVRAAHRRGPGSAAFRTGPFFAWCPAENRATPHALDAGCRRCRSCKTSTPTTTSGETHG